MIYIDWLNLIKALALSYNKNTSSNSLKQNLKLTIKKTVQARAGQYGDRKEE